MYIRFIRNWLILVVVLSSQAFASDYLSTNATVIIYARSALGVSLTNTTYLSDSTGALWIRGGIAEIEPLLKTIKSVDSFITAYKQGVYALDSTVVGITGVLWSKNDSTKSLVFMPKEQWYKLVPEKDKKDDTKSGYDIRPGYYDFDDDRIYLFPVPVVDANVAGGIADTIKIFSWKSNSNNAAFDTTSTLATMPQQYRKAVLQYVIWQAGQARQSVMSQVFKQDYNETLGKISQSKGVRVVESSK